MDVITNENGQLRSCEGPDAVEAYRLKVLISALKLEIKCPGMKLSRGVSALKVAKQTTGLRSNDRALHVQRLELMLEAQLGKVLIVTDGV